MMTLDVFKWEAIHVTPSTLLKKKEYQGLSETDQWEKALENGWRFDRYHHKFYRLVKTK